MAQTAPFAILAEEYNRIADLWDANPNAVDTQRVQTVIVDEQDNIVDLARFGDAHGMPKFGYVIEHFTSERVILAAIEILRQTVLNEKSIHKMALLTQHGFIQYQGAALIISFHDLKTMEDAGIVLRCLLENFEAIPGVLGEISFRPASSP